ncbi:MAG: D-alanyl-D-alanine carboxypeptidase [Desulfamplus sp.]|nr:D-alanyl-D-alanine carboxypeptidase [Desulfamplus sp.]
MIKKRLSSKRLTVKVCLNGLYLFLIILFLQYNLQAMAGVGSSSVINSKAGIMLTTEKGMTLFSQNANTQFTPASILKVLTSLCARYYFQDNYHFKTEFFIDNREMNHKFQFPPNSKADLRIKGYGDPLFTSELIAQACHQLSQALRAMNISQINNIIVDNTFFASDIKIDGTASSNNPYDAFVGPLCANFNTVSFKYSHEKQNYVSAEPQTPLLPFVLTRVKNSGLKEGRVILSEQESKIYAGMLVQNFLSQEGINIKGVVTTGDGTISGMNNINDNTENRKTDPQREIKKDVCRPVYTYTSPYDMDEIIKRLLKYSSNFMANQLFLSVGAQKFSPPATVEKSIAAMTEYAQKSLRIKDAVFVEGSGLSRQNKISPADMIKILGHFKKSYRLMQTDSIPDGRNEYYKTGTLNGVRTRCGYIETSKGLYPFVIMVNENSAGYDKIKQFLWKTLSDYERKG